MRDNSLVYARQIQRIVAYQILELLKMNDVERAMKAYREMSDEMKKEILPILLAVAIDHRRKPILRLIVNKRA